MRNALSDAEWQLIEPILPCKPRRVPRVNDRCVLNGIFWILHSGALWRDLPERYGPYTSCYNRFIRWCRAGIRDHILAAIARREQAEDWMIYSTVVRVHQNATCTRDSTSQSFGRSRGGLTTKIHAVVDANGLPLQLTVSGGQQHDSFAVPGLLASIPKGTRVLSNKAYDSNEVRAFVGSRGGWANIPAGTDVSQSASVRISVAIEIKLCAFLIGSNTVGAYQHDMKNMLPNFLAFIKLAAIRLWLGVYESMT